MAIFGSVIVSAAASTASVALAGGTFMLGSAMSHFLISTALGAALYALSPRPSTTGVKGYSIAGSNGSAMDHQIIYGRTKVGGARVYDATTETNNRFLHRILVFAGHEVQSYDEIYLNDELVTLDGSGNVTSPSRYVGLVRIKRYFGTAAQTADADLVSETAGLTEDTGKWTTDHRLQGLAYLYIRFKYDQDSYPNGVPTVSAVIKGKKVFDPRTSLTAWSDNPALCIRDYLTNTTYGMSVATTDVNDAAFIAAANLSEQSVEGEERYTCNGSFTTASKPFDVMQGLLSSMGGILWYSAGQWKVKAASYTSPVMSFTDDDLRSGISIQPRHSRRDNFNTVKGTFAGPSSDWQVTDYPEVTDAVFVAEDDGKVQAMDLPLPFTSSELTAQRIARIALFRNREQITVRASFSLKALGIEVGDNIAITNTRMGWSNKPFEVINWSFGVSEDGAAVVNTALRETSSEAFLGVNGQALLLNNTTLPDPFDIPAPSNLTASNSTVLNTDGTVVSSIFVAWDAVTTGFTGYYDFEWKLSTASVWNSVDVSDTQFQIVPAVSGATYNVRVRAVNALGVRGSFATLNATGGADTVDPGVPTSFTASAGPERINLRWTNPTAADFSKVQIRRGTTNVFANSVQIAETTGTAFIDDNIGAVVTRFYWIRALDRSGNASAYAGPVSATSTTRIESGATLPSTGNYEGRLFYNETDGKLYRYHNGAWTAEVPTTDLSGVLDVSNFATTIRPVEVLGALPSTGNFEGRVVYLTTNNKLYRHTGSPLDATGFTVATDGADIVANSITAGQIAAGAIGADEIAAQAITASKLAVSDFTNLVPDNQIQEVAAWSNPTRFSIVNPTTVSPAPSKGELRYTGAFGIGNQVSGGPRFPVIGGQEYWYNYALARTSGTTYRAWANLLYYDKDGALLSNINLGSITTDRTNGSPLYIQGSVTVPSTAVEAQWRFIVNTDLTDSVVRCWIPTIRLKNGGELIVDGAITATKIATNAVTADKMAANSITAANAAIANATVDTLQIRGQAVTVPVRIIRGSRVGLTSSSTWVRIASLSIPRDAGFQTLLKVSFSYDAAGTQTMVARVLRGTTQVATGAFTTGERGAQMQGSWLTYDANTQAGDTVYHLEFRRGSLAGATFQVNTWNVFFEAEQVLR